MHKWALAPKGAAFLYARPQVQGLVEPLIVSWGYHATPETTSGSQFQDYLGWSGAKDPAAALSVPAAIRFMQEHDWHAVQQRCHEMLAQAIGRICELVGMEPPYALESELYRQMGIAPLPAETDIGRLKARLYDEERVEVPLTEWCGRKFVRISVQGYNTAEDVEALCRGLKRLLPMRGSKEVKHELAE